MVKVIDIDELFDKYIKDYVYGNIGKVKPEEIENRIPELYVEFGNANISELDGKTPNTYYADYSAGELLECLKRHLEEGVSVSDFLCEAITSANGGEDALINAIENDQIEEFTVYCMNMLGDLHSKKVASRYLDFILWDYSVTIRELATEFLSDMAENVKEKVLACFADAEEDKKENLTEILSNCKNDDRVFDILLQEFAKHQDNLPMYANYLAKYGDDRAIPVLIAAIENEKINYSDFEELRFAIEALGGTYEKPRDFSKDKLYKKIKSEKNTKVVD